MGWPETRTWGLRNCVVLDAVNHFGPKHGQAVLDLALPELPAFVKGFSNGWAGGLPLPGLGAHLRPGPGRRPPASPPTPGRTALEANVREAILEGGVCRIVHGIRADDATFALLAERCIPVDVCPSSNRALASDVIPHPLPRMLAAGVRCALGTDDPG